MSKLQTKWIADNAITAAKINTSAIGNGITGGNGTALAVSPKTNGGIAVDGTGVSAVTDSTTVGVNGSGQIYVVSGGIGATQINVGDSYVWTGTHNFTGATITVPTITGGSSSNAPTTKAYVDALIEGITWKNAVLAASTANLTLSGEQTVDGVALVAGDRILVKDQTDLTENGIYEVSTTAWVRTTDADVGTELVGAAVMVIDGTAGANKQFIQTATSVTIGVTDITFVQFGGGQTYVAGTGLLLTGNSFSVRMGAGLVELPAGEVGIDLATNSGLTVGAGGAADQLSIDPDATTGATVVPINLNSNGAGILVDDATVTNNAGTLQVKTDGIDTTNIDWGSGANQVNSNEVPVNTGFTPSNYTPSGSFAGITNHLAGIDTAIAGISTESTKQVGHTITAGEVTAGYIDISGWTDIPANAQSVRITPLGGPEQANYIVVSALVGVTPDYEVSLTGGSERIIINASGSPTVTLSGDLTTGDNLIVEFVA